MTNEILISGWGRIFLHKWGRGKGLVRGEILGPGTRPANAKAPAKHAPVAIKNES